MRALAIALPLLTYLAAGCLVLTDNDSDSDSGAIGLRGAGWSFNLCTRGCVADLQIDGTALTLTLRDRRGDPPAEVRHGTLTDKGAAELAEIDDAITEAPLAEFYGCPDCADGGASYVDRRSGFGFSLSRSTYETNNPPPPLTAAHPFLLDVIDTLESCQSSLRVVVDTCTQQ
jgi:hypothetical protein